MSVCAPSRFEENNTPLESARNWGWLSYPGLFVMLIGRPTAIVTPAFARGAR
jgi:hypothetical protein